MKAALLGAAIWGLAFNANANAQDDQPFRLLALQGQYVKWGASATSGGTVVTYAFATARVTVPGARNCGEIGPIAGLLSKSNITEGLFRKEAEAAFAMWQAAANIRFSEISDPATAGIVIGAQVAPTGRAFANVSHHASNGPVAEIERLTLRPLPRAAPPLVGRGRALDRTAQGERVCFRAAAGEDDIVSTSTGK